MIDASKDKRIVNLFNCGSHHRNLSVIYIVQDLFHQGKGNRSIGLNSHYLVLLKNSRDKLQILTLAYQMYPRQTDFFLNQYEEAVKRLLLLILLFFPSPPAPPPNSIVFYPSPTRFVFSPLDSIKDCQLPSLIHFVAMSRVVNNNRGFPQLLADCPAYQRQFL